MKNEWIQIKNLFLKEDLFGFFYQRSFEVQGEVTAVLFIHM